MTIAGYGVGAATGIVYLRGEYAYLLAFLESLLKERREAGLLGRNILGKQGFDFDIRIQLGAGAYICGEETALLSSCEGKRGDPKNRPPFPAQSGYLGRPTVINNVETFCCVARILENGPGWFSSIGTTTARAPSCTACPATAIGRACTSCLSAPRSATCSPWLAHRRPRRCRWAAPPGR